MILEDAEELVRVQNKTFREYGVECCKNVSHSNLPQSLKTITSGQLCIQSPEPKYEGKRSHYPHHLFRALSLGHSPSTSYFLYLARKLIHLGMTL